MGTTDTTLARQLSYVDQDHNLTAGPCRHCGEHVAQNAGLMVLGHDERGTFAVRLHGRCRDALRAISGK